AGLWMDDFAILFQYSRSQPLANQVQKGSILDSLFQHFLQPLPLDIVKEPFDVRFHHELVPAKLQLSAQAFKRVVRAYPGSVAISARQEVNFVYSHEDLRLRLLL